MEQAGELTDDALTGAIRILQRKKGHRFSVDDVLTAREACEAAFGIRVERGEDAPAHHIDLGCGIGSVLLMVADRLGPRWSALGVEAQEVSFSLAEKNIERNSLCDRVSALHGDFREEQFSEHADLVTGTPPYFPLGTSIPSPDTQRAYARIEYRGGVEDYLRTAARCVKPGGRVVVCGDARKPERVTKTAAGLGLQIERELKAYPRAGRNCLFTVWTMRARLAPTTLDRSKTPEMPTTWEVASWTARDEGGRRTDEAHELRRYFGLPPNLGEPASP